MCKMEDGSGRTADSPYVIALIDIPTLTDGVNEFLHFRWIHGFQLLHFELMLPLLDVSPALLDFHLLVLVCRTLRSSEERQLPRPMNKVLVTGAMWEAIRK